MKICSNEITFSIYGCGGPSFGGFSTGVTNGVRNDGQKIGFGCGDAKTDWIVPDVVFKINLVPACQAHDVSYATCGVTKQAADSQLGVDVSNAFGGGLLGQAVGGTYQAGVTLFGQNAYDSAQAAAGCINPNLTIKNDTSYLSDFHVDTFNNFNFFNNY